MKLQDYFLVLLAIAVFTNNKLFVVLTAIPCVYYAIRALIEVCKMRD